MEPVHPDPVYTEATEGQVIEIAGMAMV